MTTQRSLLLALLGALVIGGGLRLYELDRRTLSHPEYWVPRLDVPEHVQHPPPRHGVRDVVEQSLSPDVHPPGYHLVMLGWNGTVGTGLRAMRLSSVLAGLAAILAMFGFARSVFGGRTAVLATGLLALHGYHVFWSQQLRPWVLLSAIALITCILLVQLADRWRGWRAAALVLLTAAGLWIDYYFWPLVAGQILWVLLNLRGDLRARALSLQLGAVLLAFPVFVYLRFHIVLKGHLGNDVLAHLVWLTGFGGLLPYVPRASLVNFPGALLPIGASVIGFSLWVVGLRRSRRRSPDASESSGMRANLPWLLIAAAVNAILIEVLLVESIDRRRLYVAVVLAPFILAAAAPPLIRRLHRADRVLDAIRDHRIVGVVTTSLPAMVVVTPLLLFVGAGLVGRSLFVDYTLVPLMPFVLVLIAAGIVASRRAAVPLAIGVLAAFALSNYQWWAIRGGGRSAANWHGSEGSAWPGTYAHYADYQELAGSLIPHVEEGDVVLVRSEWWSEPIHYYLPPDEYTVIAPPRHGTEEELEIWRAGLPDRLWL
ncbi:MAG: glycosyltransferase family 39 protein, partial [Gemmatimonadetes bacterium]|nr:glycosyltransferase family 39 protein [Gemmatimonadota bacterium]